MCLLYWMLAANQVYSIIIRIVVLNDVNGLGFRYDLYRATLLLFMIEFCLFFEEIDAGYLWLTCTTTRLPFRNYI